MLIVCSSDGYLSFIRFQSGSLGETLEDALVPEVVQQTHPCLYKYQRALSVATAQKNADNEKKEKDNEGIKDGENENEKKVQTASVCAEIKTSKGTVAVGVAEEKVGEEGLRDGQEMQVEEPARTAPLTVTSDVAPVAAVDTVTGKQPTASSTDAVADGRSSSATDSGEKDKKRRRIQPMVIGALDGSAHPTPAPSTMVGCGASPAPAQSVQTVRPALQVVEGVQEQGKMEDGVSRTAIGIGSGSGNSGSVSKAKKRIAPVLLASL